MNAFTLLPVAVPLMAAGIYGMLMFARWLDRPTLLRRAIAWHNAVVDHEVAQGIYVHDGSITDINPVTFM